MSTSFVVPFFLRSVPVLRLLSSVPSEAEVVETRRSRLRTPPRSSGSR